ncbi:uncharacterized protein with PQ loop repeat [Rheinheimera pacifica]|nr:hypothetical protein [Rheinheimera pacifica]MCS4308248.1 uncharacterized protein with PQ loop repeat [Rheinheimera pacifica]
MMGQKVTSIQVTGMAVVLLGLMLPQLLKLIRQRNTAQIPANQ